ncbi:FAD-dependent oxidoreductase [Desulforegula conservatrix]|uniref:FAD-dependent oxidoreductase n=1 Tax=Desulforegula conservatrix TaxID=153026 RepID=UPI00040AD8B3|nr:FAD-dependent oxidoreductase [Desulforegula conservatrix]
MSKKYGAYICTGCGIGESLDMDKLAAVASDQRAEFKTHPCLCGEEGIALINKDIAENGINALAIAACSRRVNFDVFKFEGCVIDRVNLREGVVWTHSRDQFPAPTPEQKDDAAFEDKVQLMANDYLKMGLVRLEKIKLPEPFKTERFSKKILVIGGGVTGMSAALDAARTGYQVTIVEKTDKLGGWASVLRKQTPTALPFEAMENPIAAALIDDVAKHPNIEVKTGTVIARIAGMPGEFTVTFKKPGEKIEFDCPLPVPPEMKVDANGKPVEAEKIQAIYAEMNEGRADVLTLDPNGELFGSVILAAGFSPAKLEGEAYAHLGLGNANVITNAQFEEMAAKGRVVRPSDKKPAKSVVFVQSPGKDGADNDFPYCGSVTSMVALKQAKYVRADYEEDGKAYIIYQHMKTPGFMENFYKSMQQDPGVFMTKGEVAAVEESGSNLLVNVKNTLLGENIQIKADLVVLAAGMVPATVDDPVINLAYRQGPGFRDNAIFDGYADSNFICFPYETQRTGIYAAGAVRRSMTIEESMEDAAGAALKAIQCLESSNKGVAVHPRSGDMTYPDFFFQRCTQCKRCTEECPFGALDDDAKGTPKPNPTRCRRCGTCMGACPERIIGFADYNIDSIGSMIKNIWVPTDYDYDPVPMRILGLVCENDALPALDIAAMNRINFAADVRIVPVRCLGSVNVVWIKDALSQGMDGVFLMGCKHGDDYQCHFVKGSELMSVRSSKMGDTLLSLGLENERVAQFEVAIDEFEKAPKLINDFVAQIEALGPNPFKGF